MALCSAEKIEVTIAGRQRELKGEAKLRNDEGEEARCSELPKVSTFSTAALTELSINNGQEQPSAPSTTTTSDN